MRSDPFGNLRDWGPVLEQIHQLADEGNLGECQPGLIRILRYRDNWRLREEVLSRIGTIDNPDESMLNSILNTIADERLYFEARILACQAMEELMKKSSTRLNTASQTDIVKTLKALCSTVQPPYFEQALRKLDSVVREKCHIAQ
jgi:hypothetical protein